MTPQTFLPDPFKLSAGEYVGTIGCFAAVLALILILTATPTVALAKTCASGNDTGNAGGFALSVHLENDALGGRGQDQNYTGGTIVTVRSPDLTSFTDDPCLPSSLRWFNQKLLWLQPDDVTQRNFVFGVAHLAFTPSDRQSAEVIASDRPYASALLFSFGYNGRNGDDLKVTQLRVGMVGPVTQGERAQNGYHDALGLQRLRGWNNQLRNELLVQLVHERLHRWSTARAHQGWGTDVITHWGGGLGNFATYANAGVEWRTGWRLPDDFGSAAVRPAGDNTAPGASSGAASGNRSRSGSGSASSKGSESGGHLFVSIDSRGVLRDITLDGNTFESSHSIKKHRWVSDLGLGFSWRSGQWKVTMARYLRTREFTGQKDVSAFGGITVGRVF